MCLKWVNFIIYKLYLNKVKFLKRVIRSSVRSPDTLPQVKYLNYSHTLSCKLFYQEYLGGWGPFWGVVVLNASW